MWGCCQLSHQPTPRLTLENPVPLCAVRNLTSRDLWGCPTQASFCVQSHHILYRVSQDSPLHSRARCTPCPAKSRSLFFHFGARHDEAGYSSSHTSVSFVLLHFPLILLSIIREAGNWCASTLLGPRARQVLFENWNALRLNHDVSQKKPCISENCAYNSNGHNWIRISCLQSNACAEFLAKLLILKSRINCFSLYIVCIQYTIAAQRARPYTCRLGAGL